MITDKQTEVVPLTLRIAKHYSRMAHLDGDRDINSSAGQTRIENLRKLNVSGYFYSPVWSSATVTAENGKKYRLDGAHSSAMLVAAGADFPEGLSVTLRKFQVETKADAMGLWENFNPTISTRSNNDKAKNRVAYIPALKSIGRIPLIMSAARGIKRHFYLHDPSNALDALEYIRPYSDFIAAIAEFIECTPALNKTGVTGAMFATWGRDRKASDKFWRRVRDGSGSDTKCPMVTLNTYLTNQVAITKAGGATDKQPVVYIKCLRAWNAWRKGVSTRLSIVKGGPLPVAK